jgi:hypothetical protein
LVVLVGCQIALGAWTIGATKQPTCDGACRPRRRHAIFWREHFGDLLANFTGVAARRDRRAPTAPHENAALEIEPAPSQSVVGDLAELVKARLTCLSCSRRPLVLSRI